MYQLPIISRYSIDPQALTRGAHVCRLSDIPRGAIRDLSYLTKEPAQTVEDLITGPCGSKLLKDLRHSLSCPQSLWLLEANLDQKMRLAKILGHQAIHWAEKAQFSQVYRTESPADMHPGTQPAPSQERICVWALKPILLLNAITSAWPQLSQTARSQVRRHLHGIDCSKLPVHARAALSRCRIHGFDPHWFRRYLLTPTVAAYAVVLIYSALRVLPVSAVKEFHGNLWALWSIDLLTAIPYTWGVLAMFSAPRILMRMIGTITTSVTFTAPYVYFAMNGRNYPKYVIVVVVCLILAGFLVEGAKYFRERKLRKRAQRGY